LARPFWDAFCLASAIDAPRGERAGKTRVPRLAAHVTRFKQGQLLAPFQAR
jgi:hypothetical protein